MSQQTVHNQAAELKRLREEKLRLRAENAALHKVIIDAMASLGHGSVRQLSDNIRTLKLCDQIQAAINILDSAPTPSDETLATIEAGEDKGQ